MIRKAIFCAALVAATPSSSSAQSFYDSLKATMGSAAQTAKEYVPAGTVEGARNLSSQAVAAAGDMTAGLAEATAAKFDDYVTQLANVTPLLDQMGFEVATFRVKMALPPRARLRFRSKNGNVDDAAIKRSESTPVQGTLASFIIANAITARRLQKTMRMETAILDVDFALPPKVKISFMNRRELDLLQASSRFDDIDLVCGMAMQDE